MSISQGFGLAVAIVLLVYFIVAMVRPERF
jgi:K+-transporting ATPase KdpF subunit